MPDAGDSLRHFRLLEKIGEGGMGPVWKALDGERDREVAIKVLPPALARVPERLARLEQEAKAVAALDHPNIVTIHSVEEAEGIHFINMELVRGKTLAELIPADGLPVERLLEWVLPLIEAISAAHEHGLTHRDLAPEKIMVGEDGRVKILDFGLASFRESEEFADTSDIPTETLTQGREDRGTLAYMAPEQIQGQSVDHRADIFSIGAILYESATGRRPFEGETPVDLITAILRDHPRPLIELNPALPPQLERIIGRCIEKEPRRRFRMALDLHNELLELKTQA